MILILVLIRHHPKLLILILTRLLGIVKHQYYQYCYEGYCQAACRVWRRFVAHKKNFTITCCVKDLCVANVIREKKREAPQQNS